MTSQALSQLATWLRRHEDNSFGWLLLGTLVLLVTYPFLPNTRGTVAIQALLVLGIFLSSSLGQRRNLKLLGLTFGLLLGVLGTGVWVLTNWSYSAEVWHAGITAAFYLAIIVATFRFILTRETVSRNVVYAALSVYLMFAFAWTELYMLLELTHPGSFSHVVLPDGQSPVTVSFFYFSMITITTVGFGDIVPVTPPARMLTICEAMVGQLYLVAVVATVVGLRTTVLVERLIKRQGLNSNWVSPSRKNNAIKVLRRSGAAKRR